MTETSHGILWFSTTQDLVNVFEEFLPGKSFLDLGSGNGEVVKLADKFTSHAHGIEIEKGLFSKTEMKEKIIFDNFFNHDFSKWDVIYYFLKGSKHELELILKLNDEFEGILIIYYRSMEEKQTDVFASYLKADLVKIYPYIKVYSFPNRKA